MTRRSLDDRREPAQLDRRVLSAVALSLAVLAAGCKAPTSLGPNAGGEDTLKRAKGGTASLPTIQTRELRLKARDGRALNGVVVQVGGKNLIVRNGVVNLPDEAWLEAQKTGRLVVIGAGFLPLTLSLDGSVPAEIVLTPTEALGKPGIVSQAGGTLGSAGDQAMITIPTNLLTGGDTPITVGTYQPTLEADVQSAFNRDVAAFLEARSRATGGTATGGACGAPFACDPVTAGLGVAVTIDGPVQAGELSVSLDLAKMLKGWDGNGSPPASFTEAERSDAIAAARILETFRNFDATNDPTWRATMRDAYGITLDNTLLTFPVKLGDVSAVGGIARVEVDGLTVLGARLEVTVISAEGSATAGSLSNAVPISPGDVPLSMIQSKLPDYLEASRLSLTNGSSVPSGNGPDAIVSLVANNGGQLSIMDDDTDVVFSPAQLLTNNGGALISNATGGVALIANNSGGLISNNSGGLISNNSGGVVSSNGGGFVSNNSGGLVSNNSGGLVSNNSGGFTPPTITGYPFFPFEPTAGKYQLLQIGPPVPSPVRETAAGLFEYLWPNQTRVRAVMATGAPITDWTTTDGSGEFTLKLPENVPIVFFLQAELTIRGTDGLPRMAYSLAFAPGKKRTTDVAVDASTTMIATSTLHLLDYIPPEYARLTGLADSFEAQVKAVVDQLPDGVDLNDVSGGGTAGGGGKARPYQVFQATSPSPSTSTSPTPTVTPTPIPTVDPKVLEAKKQIAAMNSTINAIEGRVQELEGAWAAFNPFLFGSDLGDADKTIDQVTAVRIATSTTLRRAYDPMYGFATASQLRPISYRAINPDSPPVTFDVPAQ